VVGGPAHEIERAYTILTCPGRNFVTLKILTDGGVYGLAMGPKWAQRACREHILDEHVIPCLVGRDPRNVEDIWQYLYRGAYWRRGPVTMAAIAAVDVALWDIKGKLAGMPVYQLLGGRSRAGAMVYSHANGRDHAETVEAVGRYLAKGFKAIRVQSGVPGLEKVYGVGKGSGYYEPAQKGLPPEEPWDTALYLRHTPELFRKVREAHGYAFHLLHDAHHRLTPIEAARLGKDSEPFRLFWIEDPTPAENQESFRLIRQHTTTPLAVGEIFNSIWDCKDLISEQLIDYVRATIVRGRHYACAPHCGLRSFTGCAWAFTASTSPYAWPRR
jgi:mannonate dehydratase